MNEKLHDVVVVGGGISGLTAAWRLKHAGVDVQLLEAASKVGGCAGTERRDGFLLEKGPFNIIVRDPAFQTLLTEFADTLDIVSASRDARKRFIYRNGRLHAVPTNPVSLATTGLLSAAGKARLIAGLVASRRPCGEETIGQSATRRFGQQVSDNMVSAVIAGIFAGDVHRLSLKACFPGAHQIDCDMRSPIGFALSKIVSRRSKPAFKRRWKGLVSLRRGLGELADTIGQRLGSGLLRDCTVTGIRHLHNQQSEDPDKSANENAFEVDYVRPDGETSTVRCRRLVLASPAHVTGRLLHPLAPAATDLLNGINCASLVVVNLGFRRADVGHPLNGFGFLVPGNEPDFPLLGTLWADTIFPHHASPDSRLIRVFIGGSRDPAAIDRSDDALRTTAIEPLRQLLDIRNDPVLVDICRFRNAIPQNHVGHAETINSLRAAVEHLPGLHLIGNYLEGVSINDCVRLATTEAERIADALVGAPNTHNEGNTPGAANDSLKVAC